MNISVVIPSFNAGDYLHETLLALSSQQTRLRYEVIVVDCSDDSTVEGICEGYDLVRCHRVLERFNPGTGRNIGADLARGDLLLFVDADVIVSPLALEAAWQFKSSGGKVFGGCLELNEEDATGAAAYFEHYFFNHEAHRLRRVSIRRNLSSALLACDRSTFLKNGGFKDIPRMQDTELTERMAHAGEKLMFNPELLGWQRQDSSLKNVLSKIYINGKNLYFIRYSNYSIWRKLALVIAVPCMAALKVVRIFFRHMRYHESRQRFLVMMISPLLAVGGLVWMLGLYHSLLLGKSIGESRD